MKIFKWFAVAISTILLGALGSGLWERVFSGFFDNIYRLAVELVANIYSGYLDIIYQEAARDTPDIYLKKIAFQIFIIVSVYLIFSGLKNRKWSSSVVNKKIEDLLNGMYLWAIIIGFYILIISFFSISTFSYSSEVKSYAFHSMEILRPYVGENKYLYLKSQYYQIHSEADFLDFNEALKEESKAHSVTIPNFKPIK